MLQRRWFFAAVIGVGVVLALPSLGVGFVADDYTFINRLEEPGQTATFRLYEFADGRPGQPERAMSERWVAFPWWMSDGFKVRFLRPLSSGLIALDHAVFARAPLGYHVHSLLWYAALLLAVGGFLRRVCPAPTWQLAFLLFALNGGHAEAAAWIASRHVLVSTVPVLLGLIALIEQRERGFRLGVPLAVLGLGVGLLGGESALIGVCFWLAYEAWGAPNAAWRTRAVRLAVPLGCAGAYLLVYRWLGYGTSGSAVYLDPGAAPGPFLAQLPARLAMLLGEMFTGFPSNLSLTTFPAQGSALGACVTLLVALTLRSLWPSLEPGERRSVIWLSVGALLALVVSAGAFLGSRLLLMPGIAGFLIIASVLRHGWGRARSAVGTLGRRALVAGLAFAHVGCAPLVLLANSVLLGRLGAATEATDIALDAHFAQHLTRGAPPPNVFVLTASDPFAGFYTSAVRVARAPESTAQWTMLSMARGTHQLERTDVDKLVLRLDEGLLRATFEGLFRPAEQPFAAGERVALVGAHLTILTVTAGHPTAIELTLERGTFDDPGVCLLAWRERQLVPVELALHQKLTIPWSPGPTGLL